MMSPAMQYSALKFVLPAAITPRINERLWIVEKTDDLLGDISPPAVVVALRPRRRSG